MKYLTDEQFEKEMAKSKIQGIDIVISKFKDWYKDIDPSRLMAILEELKKEIENGIS